MRKVFSWLGGVSRKPVTITILRGDHSTKLECFEGIFMFTKGDNLMDVTNKLVN